MLGRSSFPNTVCQLVGARDGGWKDPKLRNNDDYSMHDVGALLLVASPGAEKQIQDLFDVHEQQWPSHPINQKVQDVPYSRKVTRLQWQEAELPQIVANCTINVAFQNELCRWSRHVNAIHVKTTLRPILTCFTEWLVRFARLKNCGINWHHLLIWFVRLCVCEHQKCWKPRRISSTKLILTVHLHRATTSTFQGYRIWICLYVMLCVYQSHLKCIEMLYDL